MTTTNLQEDLRKAITDVGILQRMKGVDAPQTIQAVRRLEALAKSWEDEQQTIKGTRRGRGAKPHVDTPEETRANAINVEGRMPRPAGADDERLEPRNKVIDYGHVNDLLKEKYGPDRGEKSYQDMANAPNVNKGLHFVVGQNIQKEKQAMMRALGKHGPAENHDYQGLHTLYFADR